MPFHEEADPLDENHRGETDVEVADEDWANALIESYEKEGHQVDGDDVKLPNAVQKAMERALAKAWVNYVKNHRPRNNHNETVATNERLIQRITDTVCLQLGV